MNASQQSDSTIPPPLTPPDVPWRKRQASPTFLVVVIGGSVCISLLIVAVVITKAVYEPRPGISQPVKPEMPITLSYRKSLMGEAYVTQFFNRSDRHLVVIADCENPTLHAKKSIRVEIAPRATIELGWAEGWKFVSGDTIRLSHADYANLSGKIP